MLRQVVPHEVVDLLRATVAQRCEAEVLEKGTCQWEQSRWFDDVMRDWILYGPVGGLAQQVLRRESVRVVQEGAFGHRRLAEGASRAFSYGAHIDRSSTVGIYGGIHSSAAGASVWMPLHDLDPQLDGGSIHVFRGWPSGRCVDFARQKTSPRPEVYNWTEAKAHCTVESIFGSSVVPAFRKGDLIFWHPDMLHKTQELVRELPYIRYSWYARLVEGEARACMYACFPPMMPCCRTGLRSGDVIHTPCMPQIYPDVLPAELHAHLARETSPLWSSYQGRARGSDNPAGLYWHDHEMPEDCQVALRHEIVGENPPPWLVST